MDLFDELDEEYGSIIKSVKKHRVLDREEIAQREASPVVSTPVIPAEEYYSTSLESHFAECRTKEDYEYYNTFYEDGWVGKFNLDLVLSYAIEMKASDVHIASKRKVAFTILGDIEYQERFAVPDEEVMSDVVAGMLSHEAQGLYVRDLDYGTSYEIKFGPYRGRRFRANIGKTFGDDYVILRVISNNIPSMEDIKMEPEIRKWTNNTGGGYLIVGSTGSGKSTTLASLLRDIQINEKKKIITIEKPIEYVYPDNGKGYILQRAIPEDCLDFTHGLTACMREAPDIILIGEIRNQEEIMEFLKAITTGHLGLSTIHAENCVTAINRIKSTFNGNEQLLVLTTLADSIKGLCTQVLLKNKAGTGRFAVREILEINPELAEYIREGETGKIELYMIKHKLMLEHKLAQAYLNGMCTKEEAFKFAKNKALFEEACRG